MFEAAFVLRQTILVLKSKKNGIKKDAVLCNVNVIAISETAPAALVGWSTCKGSLDGPWLEAMAVLEAIDTSLARLFLFIYCVSFLFCASVLPMIGLHSFPGMSMSEESSPLPSRKMQWP